MILARMMSRDPAARQASLLACAHDLQRAQHELGLPITALEVADEAWASAGMPVDFNNSEARGPVISDVALPSRRSASVARRPVLHTYEGTLTDVSNTARRRLSPLMLSLLLAGAVGGGGATVGALRIAGLI
jgi:hypothetical protein